MLVVRNIKVRSLSTDYAHVLWQVEPTSSSDPVTDYNFYVLRSGAQSGPYEIIGGPISDTYIFRDNRAKDRGFWVDYYYRIRAEHISSGEYVDYGSRTPEEVDEGLDPGGVSKDPEPSLIAQEIIYRHRLSLSSYSGRYCFIFPIRTFGSHCPECWNDLHGQRTKSKCTLCYGSSFVGGYHTPVQVHLQTIQDDVEQPGLVSTGKREPAEKSFFLANFPEVKLRDIIVEATNDRWRVAAVQSSRVQGALVSQRLTCTRVPKRDIEYELPVRGIDPIRFDPADERHYIGAHNPSNLIEGRNKWKPREL